MKTREEIKVKIKAKEAEIVLVQAKVAKTQNPDAKHLYWGIIDYYFAYIEALNWALERS